MGSLYKRNDLSDAQANWYAVYTDHNGKRIRASTRTSDKTAAKRILAKWEADAALRRELVIDPTIEKRAAHQLRSISTHIKEFENELKSAARVEKHVAECRRVLREVVDTEGWRQLSDISTEGLARHAAKLKELGRSNRTIQKHLAVWKQFCTWLYKNDRIGTDVLKGLKTPNPTTGRKFHRRALRPEEWEAFRDATVASGERRSMPGEHRALLYELAIQTGLRQNEVRGLTPGKCFLQQSPGYIVLPGARTKNRKPARQFITEDLRLRLVDHLQNCRATQPVFHLCDESRVAEVIRKDLEAAREQYLEDADTKAERKRRERDDHLSTTNHEKESFDFHCLRHTCGAWLAMRGENPKTIQTIMRHSSITLTMDAYGHMFPSMESQAVERLSELFTGAQTGAL